MAWDEVDDFEFACPTCGDGVKEPLDYEHNADGPIECESCGERYILEVFRSIQFRAKPIRPTGGRVMIRVVNVKGLRGEARDGVVYVGRAFAGWPASPWGNPFRQKPLGIMGQSVNAMDAAVKRNRGKCLDKFRAHAEAQPPEWLSELWAACDHGGKPLGCWCVTATHGDGQPVVCHGQILAAMLADRFQTKGGE